MRALSLADGFAGTQADLNLGACGFLLCLSCLRTLCRVHHAIGLHCLIRGLPDLDGRQAAALGFTGLLERAVHLLRRAQHASGYTNRETGLLELVILVLTGFAHASNNGDVAAAIEISPSCASTSPANTPTSRPASMITLPPTLLHLYTSL
ncbi:hypothetical protein [Achromobacter marplatensis]|uniref:hypothetical protein n=1 Tax=Achromobacter marplatensis TaxID=470868 RepID=UPI0039F6FF0A